MSVEGTKPRSQRWQRAIDKLIFAALFVFYLAALVASAKSIGYARDEGFYFHAASTYGRWFEILLSSPSRALEPSVVDRFWQENREHPALMKSLFWLSERLLGGRVFAEPGTASRFPAMVISALGVATTFAFGRRCIGRAGGVFAALSFGLMPPIFHHSHLACFDMPIAALWLIVVYAYHRSLDPRAWGWTFACAALYGLALDTKHNSWLLPPAILCHALVLALPRFGAFGTAAVARVRRRARPAASSPVAKGAQSSLRGRSLRGRSLLGRALTTIVLTMFIAPAVFYALWPWIWRDTVPRLVEYVEFHRQHVYYNIEYLGRTYFEPPFPRSYAWLMTAATVPLITLVLAFAGALAALAAAWRGLPTSEHRPCSETTNLAERNASTQRKGPTEQNAPAESNASTEPTAPAAPNASREPTASAEPNASRESTEPAAPNASTEGNASTKQAASAEPNVSTEPTATAPNASSEQNAFADADGAALLPSEDPCAPRQWGSLWALCILASYFMWLLPDTPIFGGTKHWLTAYPFLALFAGYGFTRVAGSCASFLGHRPRVGLLAPWVLGLCTLLGPLMMTWHSVPWGLSAYTPIVGGAPGAATLGLNRSFWGYTTGSVTGYLNREVGRSERVFLHDTALDSFRMLQRDGRLRKDIKPWSVVAGSAFALYHHEQHMSRVEHMIWTDYGTTAPSYVATYDGVPMIWVYRRR